MRLGLHISVLYLVPFPGVLKMVPKSGLTSVHKMVHVYCEILILGMTSEWMLLQQPGVMLQILELEFEPCNSDV